VARILSLSEAKAHLSRLVADCETMRKNFSLPVMGGPRLFS
jgi:hypothetical protein